MSQPPSSQPSQPATPCATAAERPVLVRKRRTEREDGRYVIYYEFERQPQPEVRR